MFSDLLPPELWVLVLENLSERALIKIQLVSGPDYSRAPLRKTFEVGGRDCRTSYDDKNISTKRV